VKGQGYPPLDVGTLEKGCEEFERREPRDAMYRVARDLVQRWWPNPERVADGLGVLLLTWNQAFYRYGAPDFDALESFLVRQGETLETLRRRSILDFGTIEEGIARGVFDGMLDALKAKRPAGSGFRLTPVGTAKALHLICPELFPLWDGAIAKAYGCYWGTSQRAASAYIAFMKIVGALLEALGKEAPLDEITRRLNARARFEKPLLKFVDEYNYSRFTQRPPWI